MAENVQLFAMPLKSTLVLSPGSEEALGPAARGARDLRLASPQRRRCLPPSDRGASAGSEKAIEVHDLERATGLDDVQHFSRPISGLLLPAGNPAVTTHCAAREEIRHLVRPAAHFRIHEAPATSSAETSGTVASALGRRPAQAAVPAAPLVRRQSRCGANHSIGTIVVTRSPRNAGSRSQRLDYPSDGQSGVPAVERWVDPFSVARRGLHGRR
jgi:hypothetical protein